MKRMKMALDQTGSWALTIDFDATILALEEMGEHTSLRPMAAMGQGSKHTQALTTNNEDSEDDQILHDFCALFASESRHESCKLDHHIETSKSSQPHTVVQPSENDVVYGKGGRRNSPGNQKFRAECQSLAHRYLQNPTPERKEAIAMELVTFVVNRGGRFLKDGGKKGAWQIVEPREAVKKAKQLLADAKKNEDRAVRSGQKRNCSEIISDSDDMSPPHRSQDVSHVAELDLSVQSKPTLLEVRDREQIFKQLFAAFELSGAVAHLLGNAGVGKSFIADTFTRQWVGQSPPHKLRRRFWMRAGTKACVRSSLIDILKQVDSSHEHGDIKTVDTTDNIAAQVWKALVKLPKYVEWILVVDNICGNIDGNHGEMETIFMPSLLSEFGGGRLLLTTRHENIRESHNLACSVTQIKVGPIEETAAVSLFLENNPLNSEENMQATNELVTKHCDGLPLSIVASSSEIASSGITVAQYLGKISSLEETSRNCSGKKSSCILQSSIDHARSLGFGDVLDVMAWLNPEHMERHLLPADDTAVERLCALSILNKCSCVEGDVASYSMHRLFQAAARECCGSPIAAIEALQRNGLDKFSRHDHKTWGSAFQMLPHVEALRGCYQRNEIVDDDDKVACADVLNQSGHVAMWASCNYVVAREYYEAALEILTHIYTTRGDPNNIRIATTKKDLGRVHQALGEYAPALDMYTEALRMMRGDDDENAASAVIATTLHNLGRVCLCLGQNREAERHFHASLRMKQGVQASPASIALTMANIGRIHQAAGRHQSALDQYQAIEKMKGVNYRSVFGATTRLCEGQVYQDLRDLNAARQKYEQALEVYDEVFGILAKNDAVAMAHCYLGSVLVDVGELGDAHLHLNIALDMLKHVFGASAKHDNIANVTFHMGRLYGKQGDQQNARIKYGEAKDMLDALIGDQGTTTMTLGSRDLGGML